jgi:hypothetical protein
MSEYPQEWPAIAHRVKEEAGWRCVRCAHAHSREGWRILTVHHLDGDKSNCRWWNLAALCQRCHLAIQGKVKMHQTYAWPHSEWFRPYVAAFYAYTIAGEDLSREEVEACLPELLALGQPHLVHA